MLPNHQSGAASYNRSTPKPANLKVGDRIRLLTVPQADLEQRAREIRAGVELPGWTADTLERVIAEQPLVTIRWIDEYGTPWFDVELRDPDGDVQEHTLAVYDDGSWQLVD